MEANTHKKHTSISEQDAPTQRCVACREILQPDAIVCPHCRKPQHTSFWGRISPVLKWLGGATVIVSLLGTTIKLFELMETQQDRNSAIERYLLSAERLESINNPNKALQQLEAALKLNPNHSVALEREAEIVMRGLRRLRVGSGGDVTKNLAVKAMPILERMVGSENSIDAADAMAHLAWNYHFIGYEAGNKAVLPLIGPLLDRAIEIDNDNVYAHTFWANICLGTNTLYMNIDCGNDELETAKIYWDAAEKSGRGQAFVFEAKLHTLSVSGGDDTKLYFLEVLAFNLPDDPSPSIDYYRKKALVVLWNTALETPEALLELGQRISPERLLKAITWARAAEEPLDSVNDSVREWHLERRTALNAVSAALEKK